MNRFKIIALNTLGIVLALALLGIFASVGLVVVGAIVGLALVGCVVACVTGLFSRAKDNDLKPGQAA